MNATDVIEAYVTEVASELPRKQRNDVAFELRALLNEELTAKAEGSGRAADTAMAIELLNAFGRPSEVASRYRPALNVIDPADGPAFLRASVIGLVLIWVLGFVSATMQRLDPLSTLGLWWGGTVLPSFWWPGVLVVGFAMSAWVRRRWPVTSAWQPRDGARGRGERAGLVLAVLGILVGLAILLDPRRLLDVLWRGRAAAEAYEAFTYAESFRTRQGPVLFMLLLLNVPVFVGVIIKGGWSPLLRRIETTVGVASCIVMAWAVLDGPIFLARRSDEFTKACLIVIIAITVVTMGVALARRVRPAPS